MNKFLLFALSLLIGASIYAQDRRFLNNHSKAHEARKIAIESPVIDYMSYEINEYVANRDLDIVFGETYYDLQSNSTVPHHVHAYEDGTIGTIWTRGMETAGFPACPDRGTGYNYFDGTDWGPYPTGRIEELRTGWTSYAPYGENGEIVCSHRFNSEGLVFSWRENKGTGDWNYFTLDGPDGHEFIAWPKMTTSGENNSIIHVIAITAPVASGGTIYEGLDGALLYSRSMDGGETWDPENEILDGLTSDDIGYVSADNYCWAHPKNGIIAFTLNNGIADGLIFKSESDGDSWEKITFFESPYPLQDGDDPFDAYYGSDGTSDLLIDDEGKMHIAFGRTYYTYQEGSIYYSYGVDGLVYWNEDKPVLDSTIMGDPDALEAAGCLAAWVLEGPNPEDTLASSSITTYGGGMTSFPQLAFNRDDNNIPIVNIFYTSYDIHRPLDANENTRRSIWRVITEDGGATWSEFENLTGDVYHLDKECAFPSIASSFINDTYHLVYQSDGFAGNALQPTPPSHLPTLNNMVYLPVSPLAVDVKENLEQSFEVSQNYPNPVNGQTYFTVTLNKGADLNLQVYTLTGQMVNTTNYGYKTSGTHTLTINASDLASGAYFYTVSTGTNKVIRKMIVQ